VSVTDIHRFFPLFFLITIKTWKPCLAIDVRAVIAALWHAVLSKMSIW